MGPSRSFKKKQLFQMKQELNKNKKTKKGKSLLLLQSSFITIYFFQNYNNLFLFYILFILSSNYTAVKFYRPN